MKDREKMRKMHEELRKKKQDQLKFIQEQLQTDGGIEVKSYTDLKKQ